ncbi:hypothetical protein KC345_g11894 [Hortaea werneckii]|nr:hypothetical protein KC345_g11894 [Hortaea werneckii]
MVTFIPLYAFSRKVPVYESFVEGAKDGFGTAIAIIPHLVGMLVAISVFRASGALDFLMGFISPLLQGLGVPAEVLPLGLLRPLTGTGSLAYTTDLIRVHGPDSLIGVRNGRYALKVGLFSDVVGFIAAIAVCLLVFG